VQLLLDTVTVLWALETPERLSPLASEALRDGSNQLHLSVVSIWEISVKTTRGRMKLAYSLEDLISTLQRTLSVQFLGMNVEDSLIERSLPLIHGDPFDRMLVCQAICRNLVVLTPDKMLRSYPVQGIW
jgi:PIN domain nuclease of toxin-antitoxin system